MGMNNRLLRPRASGFGPRTIANLGLWLDASDTSSLTLNANAVSEWRDKSGNGRHFSQATAANQPLTTRTQNSLRVLDFDGTRRLDGNAASLTIARNVGALTMFVVGQLDTVNADSQFFFVSRNGATAARAAVAYLFGTNSLVAGGRRLDSDSFASASFTQNTNANILTGVLDYANSDAFIFQNGTQQATNTSFQTSGNTSNTDSDGVSIGQNIAGAQSLDGWIGEIIVYQRAIVAAERRRVERYLGAKWGIAVA